MTREQRDCRKFEPMIGDPCMVVSDLPRFLGPNEAGFQFTEGQLYVASRPPKTGPTEQSQ